MEVEMTRSCEEGREGGKEEEEGALNHAWKEETEGFAVIRAEDNLSPPIHVLIKL